MTKNVPSPFFYNAGLNTFKHFPSERDIFKFCISKNVKQEQDRLGRNSSFAPSVYIDTWFSPTAARPGSVGGLFMDGEDSATANPAEDISKWSVEDVCGFISSLAGCAEYTQVGT